MGRGEARAGHQGPFNQFISQIIWPAAPGPGEGEVAGRGHSGEALACVQERGEKTWLAASARGVPRPRAFQLHAPHLPSTAWLHSGGPQQGQRPRNGVSIGEGGGNHRITNVTAGLEAGAWPLAVGSGAKRPGSSEPRGPLCNVGTHARLHRLGHPGGVAGTRAWPPSESVLNLASLPSTSYVCDLDTRDLGLLLREVLLVQTDPPPMSARGN